ncbi:MAG: hypothetical protein OEW21_11750 [Betaproteobacteria bacterium]|nr:hypothetical protein [Betaproteobacteria bacterium]
MNLMFQTFGGHVNTTQIKGGISRRLFHALLYFAPRCGDGKSPIRDASSIDRGAAHPRSIIGRRNEVTRRCLRVWSRCQSKRLSSRIRQESARGDREEGATQR